jgi:hypothetical protein
MEKFTEIYGNPPRDGAARALYSYLAPIKGTVLNLVSLYCGLENRVWRNMYLKYIPTLEYGHMTHSTGMSKEKML